MKKYVLVEEYVARHPDATFAEAARACGVSAAYVEWLHKRGRVKLKTRTQRREERERIVREGYRDGLTAHEIMAKLGTKSLTSVYQTASKLGLKSRTRDVVRGFVVPPEMRKEYNSLKRRGFTAREAGGILKLV